MIFYHVYLKDYKAKTKSLLGILPESRKTPREQTSTQAGMKWGRKVFGRTVSDPQAIYVTVEKGENDGEGELEKLDSVNMPEL